MVWSAYRKTAYWEEKSLLSAIFHHGGCNHMRTRSVMAHMEHMEHIAWDMRTAYSIDTLQSTGGGIEVGFNTEGAVAGATALVAIWKKAGRSAAFRLEETSVQRRYHAGARENTGV